MKFPTETLFGLGKGALWTVGAYGLNQMVRLGTSIVLTRLLAPELFGIMVVVNTFKNGVELISSVGISQSIVSNRNGDEPDFLNTAWTIQVCRGLILWAVLCIATPLLAKFYDSPILLWVMPVASFVLVITGFASVSLFLLQRRMAMRTFNVFDAATTLCWAGPQIALAYFMPTIWSLVFGILIGSAVWAIGTYFLLPQLQHRLLFTRSYASQIFRFGKWIFLSSVFYFLSANFDRIYLASVIPLAALGIYGISRGISELLTLLVLRLGDLLVFPFVARNAHIPRVEFRAQFASVRLHFLLMAAVALSFVVSISDLAIHTVFDERYHDASWMLPLLALGAWISILSALNESTLLGLGKPFYATVGHALKCGWLLLGLPLANDHFGLFGAIIVISTSDLVRYLATIGGQIRERFSLWGQDIIVSIVFLLLVGILNFVRWHLGLGFSFRMVPSY